MDVLRSMWKKGAGKGLHTDPTKTSLLSFVLCSALNVLPPSSPTSRSSEGGPHNVDHPPALWRIHSRSFARPLITLFLIPIFHPLFRDGVLDLDLSY